MKKKLTFEWDDKISEDWRKMLEDEIEPTLEFYYDNINRFKPGRIRVNMFGLIGDIIYEEVPEEEATTKTSEVSKTSEVYQEPVENQNLVSAELENQSITKENITEITPVAENVVETKPSEVSQTSEVYREPVEAQNLVSAELKNQNITKEKITEIIPLAEDVVETKTSEVSQTSEVYREPVSVPVEEETTTKPSEVSQTSEGYNEPVDIRKLTSLYSKRLYCDIVLYISIRCVKHMKLRFFTFIRWLSDTCKLQINHSFGVQYLRGVG